MQCQFIVAQNLALPGPATRVGDNVPTVDSGIVGRFLERDAKRCGAQNDRFVERSDQRGIDRDIDGIVGRAERRDGRRVGITTGAAKEMNWQPPAVQPSRP